MTRYAPPQPTAPRIERRQIPTGLAGTRITAAHVGRLIRDGARDFYVRQAAIDILLARRVPAKDYLGEIDALFRWVQRHVRYTKDPFRVEVLHTARRMLELRAGDCDDMTILLGALIKSVGHPVRLVLTGPDRRRPDLFSHIYLEAQHQGDWIPLDATMPYAMGWSPRAPVRLVLSIEEESTHDRSQHRPSASTATGTRSARHAAARLAPFAAAGNPRRGGARARPSSPGPVAPAAAAAAPAAGSLAQAAPAAHLASRTRQAAPPAHHHADSGPAAQMAGAVGAATAAHGAAAGHGTAVSTLAAPPARGLATRGDRAAHAVLPADDAGPRPLSGEIRDARAMYRRFTRLPATQLECVAYPRRIPPVVVELGHLTGLVYRSDKWVGRPRTYIHFLEDPPRLVCDVSGRQLFLVGGSYRVTPRGIEG